MTVLVAGEFPLELRISTSIQRRDFEARIVTWQRDRCLLDIGQNCSVENIQLSEGSIIATYDIIFPAGMSLAGRNLSSELRQAMTLHVQKLHLGEEHKVQHSSISITGPALISEISKSDNEFSKKLAIASLVIISSGLFVLIVGLLVLVLVLQRNRQQLAKSLSSASGSGKSPSSCSGKSPTSCSGKSHTTCLGKSHTSCSAKTHTSCSAKTYTIRSGKFHTTCSAKTHTTCSGKSHTSSKQKSQRQSLCGFLSCADPQTVSAKSSLTLAVPGNPLKTLYMERFENRKDSLGGSEPGRKKHRKSKSGGGGSSDGASESTEGGSMQLEPVEDGGNRGVKVEGQTGGKVVWVESQVYRGSSESSQRTDEGETEL